MFPCVWSSVLCLLSNIKMRRMYDFQPFNACRYDDVVGPLVRKYADFCTVNRN